MNKYVIRIIFLILIILNSMIIFGFSAQNGEKSSTISKSIITKIADIINVKEEKFLQKGEIIIRKLAHFGIYTLLGIWSTSFILTFEIVKRKQIIGVIIWGIIYATTDEIHQLFVNGRNGSISDVILDTLGVIFGIIIINVLKKAKEKIIMSRKEKDKMKAEIKEKGITLVSLAITIVLMLILAGFMLSADSMNGDALNLANDKKAEAEILTIKEEIKTELTEKKPNNYEELIAIIKTYGIVLNEENYESAKLITTNGNYSIYVKDIWNLEVQNYKKETIHNVLSLLE